MSADPRKRQKKKEKQAAKRKAKHHLLVKEKNAGLRERLTQAASCPILHCWSSETLWIQGMGWVCLSRRLANGFVAYAVFLVDRYCLGVKNVMAEVTDWHSYDMKIMAKMREEFTIQNMAPAAARKLVEGAVAYAGDLGLAPHADYRKAKLIFGDIDAGECTEQFEFGKDGMPMFISGPYDTPERCKRIISTLERRCGPDGFKYVALISSGSRVVSGMADDEEELMASEEWEDLIDEEMDAEDERGVAGNQGAECEERS